MTLAHLTRSLLIATVMLLLGAASVAADEPDNGLLGGTLGGAVDLVAAGGEVLDDLPIVDDVPVAPVVDVVETVVQPATRPVEAVVTPAIEVVVDPVGAVVKPPVKVVAPAVEATVKPAATTVTVASDPVAPAIVPIDEAVEPVAKPVARALRPVSRPVQRLAPVPKAVVDVVAPVADALAPFADSLAPAVEPLAPIVDAARDATRPIVKPVGGVVPPVLGPIGVAPIVDPVVRPIRPIGPAGPANQPPAIDATQPGSMAAQALQTAPGTRPQLVAGSPPARAWAPASEAGGTRRTVGLRAGAESIGARGQTAPASTNETPAPVGAMPAHTLTPAPDGGFAMVLLASMALTVIASRSSLSALRIARPPSLSFAPAVPPA